ncbi:MAG: glycosyltransferase family 4 protein [Flavobacteriales bacterium]|nr:glycosyltransferase family 4 protein [Flavobacteriales bacterium]
MKKVLIITYYWPPSGGAGVQRWLKFTKYFKEFDIEPTVITVNPNKASYPVRDETLIADVGNHVKVYTTNTFEPYGAYKKVSNKTEIPYSGFANESNPSFIQQITRFIRGNFFIPDARKGWNKYALAKARELLKEENFDAIVTTSPPHSTQLIGLKLKEEFNLPWLADLRDPWTDIYYYKYMNHTSWAKRIDAKMERMALEKADDVVVVSEAIKKMFASKSEAVDANKIHVIPNGFDEEDFKSVATISNDEFVITYTGTLSDIYDASAFITAFRSCKTKIKLKLVGRIADEVVEKLRGENIEVIGYVDHPKSIEYLQTSDALLLIIPKIENNEGILTGKLFEYLAARKPIIALGPKNGDAASIIQECAAGKMFDYSDEEGIGNYVSNLLEGKNPIDQLNKNYLNYSRKALTKQMIETLNL